MNEHQTPPVETETTEQGEQLFVPCICPVTQRERLALLMAAPLAPRREQKPLDIGLFDENARNQLDLF